MLQLNATLANILTQLPYMGCSLYSLRLPCRSIRSGSRCRWRRSGRGWGCTRPPAPRSSFLCSPPGSGSSGRSSRPGSGQSCGTGERRRRLRRRGEKNSSRSFQKNKSGFVKAACGPAVEPLCLAATSQETLGTSQ